MAPRILILTASVGEGHDLPARLLAEALSAERPGSEVIVRDGLRAMGRAFVAVSEDAPRVVFHRLQWVWDAAFAVFVGWGPTRWATQRLVGLAGSRGVLRLIDETRPDVVVSVYPITTEVLGRLRRTGRLATPVCGAITDLAAMRYWAARGVDLHLVTHAESIPEVRLVAGAGDVRCVRGLVAPEFDRPRDRGEARAALGLPATGQVVLVSGGGWGVGDLAGAIDEALAVPAVAVVAALCGRNDDLRRRLEQRYAEETRVRVEGFTDRMSDWLAAGDALVHSTAGLTVLEAHLRGCPTISYGWGRGHIRLNNRAFERFGLADVAATRADLRRALPRALARRGTGDPSFATLPTAASLVLALAA